MIILSNKDLEAYGVSQSISTLTFMGKVFVRGESFAQHFRKMAIAVAEETLQSGSPCLLVECDTHVTVWRQAKAQLLNDQPPMQQQDSQVTFSSRQDCAAKAPERPSSPSTRIKASLKQIIRGQTLEVIAPDISTQSLSSLEQIILEAPIPPLSS